MTYRRAYEVRYGVPVQRPVKVTAVVAQSDGRLTPLSYLPDDVDGRVLFERATARRQAAQRGLPDPYQDNGLGHIVMVPSALAARARSDLHAVRPFARFVEDGVTRSARATAQEVVAFLGEREAKTAQNRTGGEAG